MTVTKQPYVKRTPRAQAALSALVGVQTPTYGIMVPRLPWQSRVRRWALRKAVRMVWRMCRRMVGWRRPLAPLYLSMVVWVAAALASTIHRGWATIAAAAAVGAVPLYHRLGGPLGRLTRCRDLKPKAQRIWHAAFYAALSMWATVAAAWTALPPMLGVLVLIAVTNWIAWMWHRRARTQPVVLGVVEEFDERLQRWVKIAGQGKPLAGAELVAITDHEQPKRWEARIALPSGDLTVENAFGAHRRIASAYSTRRDNVIVDTTPGGAEDEAKLTVVIDNPCHGLIEYDQTWQTEHAPGCIPFHTYPDGFRGGLRLWLPRSGAVHGFFSGDSRSGKSAGMEAGATQAAWTGRVFPIMVDAQGGQSMPAWCNAAGTGAAPVQAVGVEGVLDVLERLRAAMYERSALLSRMVWTDEDGEHVGLSYFDPEVTGWPMVLAIFDEIHIACKDPEHGEAVVALLEEITKMSGKTGIGLWLATQYPGIEELGNKMSIRQQLVAGNVVSYRNMAGTAKGMILPSHMPSPFDILPETPDGEHTKGTAVVYSAAPRSSRATYSRSVWVRRAHHWAQEAAKRVPGPDNAVATAFASYLGRGAAAAPVAQPAPQREQVVVAEPRVKRLTAFEKVTAYLRERPTGQAHTGVIADAIGEKLTTVSTALSRAEKAGKAHQVQHGVWALGPTPNQQLVLEEAVA